MTDQGPTAGPLRLGTRGSLLARTQSQLVADSITAATGRAVELVIVRTEGDDVSIPLDAPSRPGAFAAALRDALLDDRVDLAVHSVKDLPSAPLPGLSVAAIPPRADPRDALCSRDGLSLDALPRGARVGTSSPRRVAGLLRARSDLQIVPIRKESASLEPTRLPTFMPTPKMTSTTETMPADSIVTSVTVEAM